MEHWEALSDIKEQQDDRPFKETASALIITVRVAGWLIVF